MADPITTTGPIVTYHISDFQIWNSTENTWEAATGYYQITATGTPTTWRLKPGAEAKHAYITDDDEYLHDASGTGREPYGPETDSSYRQSVVIKDINGTTLVPSFGIGAQSGSFDVKTAADETGAGGDADDFAFQEGEMDVIHMSKNPTWAGGTAEESSGYFVFRSGVPKPGVVYQSGKMPGGGGNPSATDTHGTTTVVVNVRIDELVCFVSGTMIETDAGLKPVERIAPGDLVRTKDNGFKPVMWVGSRTISLSSEANPEKYFPIRIRAGALGKESPKTDLYVSRQHRILIKSKIAQNMFGSAEVLLPAIQLVGWDGIEVVRDCDEVTYVHFLFDQHEIVYSNGAETESLYTGPEALKSVGQDAREEIMTILPQLANLEYKAPTARLLPAAKLVRKLLERHRSKERRLVEAY